MIPSNRTYWLVDPVQLQQAVHSGEEWPEDARKPVHTLDEANLIGSELLDGRHSPALDIDMPCELVESSTPGHFHLYIDCPMEWRQYRKLLKALTRAGIIQSGYLNASLHRKGTFLRKPGVKKG